MRITDFVFLHSKFNKMFTLVHEKKHPGDKGDQISGPLVYQAHEVIFSSLAHPWAQQTHILY